MQLVSQLIAPRVSVSRGVDHGTIGKILVKKESIELVWRGGSTYWSGMNGNRYSQASLQIIGIGNDRVGRELHEGGRLSARVIRECAKKIDAIFGNGTAEHIDIKKTLVLE
jgi:hypothetical protein